MNGASLIPPPPKGRIWGGGRGKILEGKREGKGFEGEKGRRIWRGEGRGGFWRGKGRGRISILTQGRYLPALPKTNFEKF